MTIMLAGAALPLLAGCGASEIASPGTGGDVIINPGNGGTVTPTPSPTPTPGALVTPAAACPTIADPQGLTNSGTITGPTGEYRVCSLPSIIARSTTLPRTAGVLYRINGRVDVGCDGGFAAPTSAAPFQSPTVGCTAANGFTLDGSGRLTSDTGVTLTVEPGVVLYAGSGVSWLAVNRGNRINAVGSETLPIVFTSAQNVRGENSDSSMGQWGGVVLLGRGRTTDCRFGSVAADTCERDTEGATELAVFGGRENAYNAGRMSYVQIRYSGFILSATFELQGLTGGGVGSGTVLDHIQSHNSSDDGAEFFGGAVNFKNYIATGADDDSLDLDTGVQANFQHVLLIQRPGQGDGLMEIDSNGTESDTPRSTIRVANFTAIQGQASTNNETSGNTNASLFFRGNSDVTLINGIVATPNNECIRMNGSGSTTTRTTLTARATLLQCNSTKYLGTGAAPAGYAAADVQAAFATGTNGNNDGYTASLTGVFINGTAETTASTNAINPRTIDTSFDVTDYIGAVKDGNATWFKRWTCNSAYAPFDDTANGRRACTSLPII
jgi:hypothetical protein